MFAKARLVVRGYEKKRVEQATGRELHEADAPTLKRESLKLAIAISLQKRKKQKRTWKRKVMDVKGAFSQARNDDSPNFRKEKVLLRVSGRPQ